MHLHFADLKGMCLPHYCSSSRTSCRFCFYFHYLFYSSLHSKFTFVLYILVKHYLISTFDIVFFLWILMNSWRECSLFSWPHFLLLLLSPLCPSLPQDSYSFYNCYLSFSFYPFALEHSFHICTFSSYLCTNDLKILNMQTLLNSLSTFTST